MRECVVCGNKYEKPIEIIHNEKIQCFDSFECAIEALAPRCSNCDLKIIGHGVETSGVIYCCDHCARAGKKAGLNNGLNIEQQQEL